MALPAHLPVEEIVLEPEEDTTGMKCIGKKVTDQLELKPAKLYIKRYILPKYIKTLNKEGLNHESIIATLPSFSIEKGLAGPGLLTQINGVNPFEWLRHVLEVIPAYKVNKLIELLPQNFIGIEKTAPQK